MTAADIQRIKELLPTTLGSEDIRATYAREILERSVFSARMASIPYLERIRDVCRRVAAGELNDEYARTELMNTLADMGHSPTDDGGLANPASFRRLDLIVKTQRQMAASVAKIANQTPETVAAVPAWELMRFAPRSAPRTDWARRWEAAGEAVGWDGALPGVRMVALKASPIWFALGNGAGGWRDTLGNPYPPFAFGSGLDWMGVGRDECVALGLIAPDESAPTPEPPSLEPPEDELARLEREWGISFEVES